MIRARAARGKRGRIAGEAIGVTREQKYREQLQEIGIYREAFDPEIHMLAMMERELQRMVKLWKAQGSPVTDYGASGAVTSNKTLDAINSMRRDILAHRDALGLTPKGLHRLKKNSAEEPAERGEGQTVLELVRSKKREDA